VSGDRLPTDFPLVDQGYDPGRVDEYIANQMLQLRNEVDTARKRIAELEAQLALDKEAEEALKMTMVIAKRASDEMLANARSEADEIVSSARREAFGIMTEARNDAETSIGEGKAIVAAARDEALNVVTEVEAETERMIAARNAALQKMRDDYEAESSQLIDRINTLRSIAADLEARSYAPPPSPPPPPPPVPSQDPPSPNAEGRTAAVSEPENAPNRGNDGDAPSADRIRESFSGRRSAKLPRIGEEAGRSALAAATAMRAHLTHEPDDSDNNDGDDDLAVRTA
jgi:cell division septum initiation protein DivIVA